MEESQLHSKSRSSLYCGGKKSAKNQPKISEKGYSNQKKKSNFFSSRKVMKQATETSQQRRKEGNGEELTRVRTSFSRSGSYHQRDRGEPSRREFLPK
jgi:hypothetical protein